MFDIFHAFNDIPRDELQSRTLPKADIERLQGKEDIQKLKAKIATLVQKTANKKIPGELKEDQIAKMINKLMVTELRKSNRAPLAPFACNCNRATEDFLKFSKSVGNDLSTPHPEFEFPGIKPGDRWCLCALRWQEAYEQGKAPPVFLESTHERTLEIVEFNLLQQYAVN